MADGISNISSTDGPVLSKSRTIGSVFMSVFMAAQDVTVQS
ncbi:hypothetical protein GMO_08800 [Gluconobacter morbifer G707]|uniref:Uncharacterized protein n=1 Tax=Gluconobacter morbifer G707 TaxID=1088869 RepID=G6XHB4_9PROT|nr:hypothetical protein GMO_08800 [Gluconobacter morbifer G707]